MDAMCRAQLLQKIEGTRDYEKEITGARWYPFNKQLDRWHNPKQPTSFKRNFFLPVAAYRKADLEEAIAFQKDLGLNFIAFQTTEPMAPALVEELGLELDKTLVMVLLKGSGSLWSRNTRLEIRDSAVDDVSTEILDVSDVPQQYQEKAADAMKQVLKATREHPEYHWLYGYLDGKKVANVYALCHDGVIEVDDLWVHPDYRHQYIATTLMKHIAESFDGVLYLHADAGKTPKEMYAAMGFETVAVTYEYYKEW